MLVGTMTKIPIRPRPKTFRGERLAQLRHQHKLTQEDLARRIGAGKGTPIHKWESGRAEPSPYWIRRLALELHTTTDFLTGASNFAEPPSESLSGFELELLTQLRLKGKRGALGFLLDKIQEDIDDLLSAEL